MDPKIEPFAELLGNVPDERIAEMAGVDVAAVAAARGDAPEPAPAPAKKGKKAATPKAPPKPPAPKAPEPAPAPAAAPKVLRLRKGVRITKDGVDRFEVRSIYRGDVAARIWNDPDVPRDLIEVLES